MKDHLTLGLELRRQMQSTNPVVVLTASNALPLLEFDE